jgi:hypothetical protein
MATKLAVGVCGAVFLALLIWAAILPSAPRVNLGAYATGLAERTPNQQYNARRASSLVDGSVISPGGTFSFNNRVGGWSRDRGYRKAPVSYNGVLVDEYGGGVCQTSTTVYNAGLLAGLTIVERHAHTFAPGYVPAGRDAAVAYENVDLRIRNPYKFPVILHAQVRDQYLVCGFSGLAAPKEHVAILSKILDSFPAPFAPVEPGAGLRRSRWRLKGRDGVRVAIFRQFFDTTGTLTSTQLVSDNTYRGISATIWSTNGQ